MSIVQILYGLNILYVSTILVKIGCRCIQYFISSNRYNTPYCDCFFIFHKADD